MNKKHEQECSVCGKPFITNSYNQKYCSKECVKAIKSISNKKWIDKNKQYKKDKDKEYAIKHKDKIRKYKRKYREINLEKIKAHNREWFNNLNEDRKLQIKERRRLWILNNKLRKLLKDAKLRAKKRNMEFNITEDDVFIPKYCPLLGIPIYLDVKINGRDNSPSLDRIDNTKGYIKGNVWIISNRANSIKRDADSSELLNIILGLRKKKEELKNEAT